MKIAFVLRDRGQWTGGINYLVNLISALSDLPGRPLVPLLFTHGNPNDELLRRFLVHLGSEAISTMPAAPKMKVASIVKQIDYASLHVFRSKGVDLVFQAADWYGLRFPIPTLAWIPDFQHRHLPRMFGAAAWARREMGFRLVARSAGRIMLSSEDARRDCERFYAASRGKTSVVHFAVPPVQAASPAALEAVRHRYGLPAKFFFLPNQFWKHKNHQVVLEALRLLRAGGQELTVAVTGNPRDARDPEYPARLLRLVNEWQLEGAFKVLGLLPFGDVQLLLQRCEALINPSLFEGWSTTVEEAKALGIPVILSDLPVHREQQPSDAMFFPAHDARSLADCLVATNSRPPRDWSQPIDALLIAAHARRRHEFALAFKSAAELALSRP